MPDESRQVRTGAAVATFSTSSLALGPHSITAVYAGDVNFTGSTSPVTTQVVNLPNSTSTSLVSLSSPAYATYPVTFSATVTKNGGTGTPTGTVTFLDGATPIGTAPVNGSGIAQFTTTSLGEGSHSMTASYGEDVHFTGSTSAPVLVGVNSAASIPTLDPRVLIALAIALAAAGALRR